MNPMLKVDGLSVAFPIRKRGVWSKVTGEVRAVDNVSFEVAPKTTMGLVGESGSGKTTLGLSILRGVEPTSGSIRLDLGGEVLDIGRLNKPELRTARRHMQMIFQDPYASLNPRMTVRDIIAEPLVAGALYDEHLSRREVDDRVVEMSERCGIARDQLKRFPHAFSGGQRQRIAIARALVLRPALVVCDEPVSALDVSIQAQVLNLLDELQAELGLTYLFIAHDLAAVAYVCESVSVMYLGQIIESGPTAQVYFNPKHPYTEALMSAVPEPDPDAPRRPILLTGERPDPAHPPSGCRFRTRCRYAIDICGREMPVLSQVAEGQTAACHRAGELSLRGALELSRGDQPGPSKIPARKLR